MTAVELAALATVLVGGALAPGFWETPPDTRCVGGDRPAAAGSQTERVEVRPKQWYQDALDRIDRQNKEAEKYAADRAVRTVVLFESAPPTSAEDTIFDGAIPELRGVAMWQQRLIEDAASDSSRVPLRVEVRRAGAGFRDAVPAVRDLIQDVKQENSGEAYEQIVGVLGFAQSTKQTQEAVKELGAIGMPMVGTTATADEMQQSDSYWPFTPANSTEAGIEAAFAAHSPPRGEAGADGPARAGGVCSRRARGDRTDPRRPLQREPRRQVPAGLQGGVRRSSASARTHSPSPHKRVRRRRPRPTSSSARCARP
ncbi:hypothetical protein NCG97_11560 [Streptomyces lydicamycinicus]|uniref:hypothetical protein n=1 Tax=Streptomyces lydicamycinicus TaxID=1546107 RepID=UPI0020358A7D|nr:hypothetical protein [Streptomyces lydicamycinicus]USA01180.1 hypothetical protein NCG97_11560 [Streptomyces lydicamycinicus]